MSILERQDRPNVVANNSGHGSQYISEGLGDQNAVYGGMMVNQHFNSKPANLSVEFHNNY